MSNLKKDTNKNQMDFVELIDYAGLSEEVKAKIRSLTPMQKIRILQHVIEFVEISDNPSVIGQLTDIQSSLCCLNAQVEENDKDSSLSLNKISDFVWTLSRFAQLQCDLDYTLR